MSVIYLPVSLSRGRDMSLKIKVNKNICIENYKNCLYHKKLC